MTQTLKTPFSLNIDGFTIGNRSFDPCATCDLFQQLNIIEGFEIDHRTGEPVILFTKDCEDGNGNWQATTGFSLWCDFVTSFPFSQQLAEIVIASLTNNQSTAAINNLFSSLKLAI